MTTTGAQTHHPSHPSNSNSNHEPTTHSNTTLNLSVLRRYLPSTTNIITIAAYSVIYIFSPTREAWEKSGIEGTLFVVRLDGGTQSESYAVFVLNRRGLDNFVLRLTTSEEVELTDEYVIVTEKEGEGEARIWGLWIFEEEGGSTRGSRERVGGVIIDCARRVERNGVEDEDDMDGQMDGGGEFDMRDGRQDSRHANSQKADGSDLMALLNGSDTQRGLGVSAEACEIRSEAGFVGSLQER